MRDQSSKEQRRAKKESLVRKELSKLLLQIKQDDSRFDDIFIHRVNLSPDKSCIRVFFYSHKGEDFFNEKLPLLILYKPSIRKALSQAIPSRYTPEIIFKYDKNFEKQCRIELLLDKIKKEDKS